MKGRLLLLAAISGCAPFVVTAQSSTTVPSDYYRHIELAENVVSSGNEMFGEQIDASSGSISFRHTVVSLPGGSGLPVEATFLFKPYQTLGVHYSVELARPYIAGVFSVDTGWVATSSTDGGATTARCSSPVGHPPELDNTDGKPERFFPEEYWTGNQLVTADGSSEFMGRLSQGAEAPTAGGPYTWATKSGWYFSCEKPASMNGAEAFVGLAPDGTRYYFEQAATGAPTLAIRKTAELGGDTVLRRKEVRFYASKIQDRFGNWVTYTTDADGALVISSNDGRRLIVSTTDSVSTVSDGARIWHVTINTASGVTTGLVVDNPDGTQWSLQKSGGISDNSSYLTNSCGDPPPSLTGVDTLVVSTPSGATATYTVKPVHFGKSFVTYQCNVPPGKSYPSIIYPAFYDSAAITKKVVTGPGISTLTWSYSYGSSNGCYAGAFAPADVECNASSPTYYQVVVTRPDNSVVRYTINNKWNTDTDGLLIKEETGTSLSSIARTVSTTWTSFRKSLGIGPKLGGSSSDYYLRVPSRETTVQDGSTFTWEAEAFDNYAHPTKVKRSNNIAGQTPVEEQTTYHNDTSLWVIGQPEQLTNLTYNEVVNKTVYDVDALPKEEWRFGQRVASYTYDNLGQLSTATDGNGQTTSYSSYRLGVPRQIDYPDQTSKTAVVNSLGQIESITDQAGGTFSYSYDSMGRLSNVRYPSGDEQAWKAESYSFGVVPGARGIAGSHLRRRHTKGDAIEETHYDALLRPILTDAYISPDDAHVTTKTSYDWEGQTTFISYAAAGSPDLTDLTSGVSSSYDVLGRINGSKQSSELGLLTTTTAYLSGAQVQVVDPRGKITTTTYQMFDEPSYAAAIKVVEPTSVTQTIARDLYGLPKSVTRAGPYGNGTLSLLKTLVYDSHHRLCRTVEPESGSEVMDYDGAGNLAWSAAGLTLPAPTTGTEADCFRSQVASAGRTVRTYDARNRLKTLTPPAGTQSTTYGYDALGNLRSTVSGISSWSATRNKLGQLTSETLQVTGLDAWRVGYAHDAYGSLRALTYPDGDTLEYSPDELGRATRVGSYAVGVQYFPNGEVSSFSYGNGTLYSADQNARRLLSNFTYGTETSVALSEDIGYDKSGNITSVTDLADGKRSKAFGYDDLDRLTSATAAHLWGTESYTYDPLNNIRTRVGNGATFSYNYETATNHLVSISGAGSSSLRYDRRGNVTSRNGSTLEFDEKNQLTQIDGLANYAYDSAGRRVMKISAEGSRTYYFYSQEGRLLYQWEPSLTRATNFIYLGSRLIARSETLLVPHPPNALVVPEFSGTGQIDVSWGATSLAESYNLEASSDGALSWVAVYSGPQTSVPLALQDGRYLFHINACNKNGCSQWAQSSTVLEILHPPTDTPTISVPVESSSGNYTVTWSGVSRATTFELQERAPPSDWRTVQNDPQTTWGISGRGDGTYSYQVRGCNRGGCGPWSVSASVVVLLPPPPPNGLTIPEFSNTGQVNLSWSSVSSAASYNLEISGDGGVNWASLYSGSDTNASLALADGRYIFRINACNRSGCSTWVQPATVLEVLHPPTEAPYITAPQGSSSGNYVVSWTSVSRAATFELQEKSEGKVGEAGNVAPDTWNTVQSGVAASWSASGKNDGTYSYQVRACNRGGCGPWSDPASVTVLLTPPSAPTLSVDTPISHDGQYTLHWSVAANGQSLYYVLLEQANGEAWTTILNGAQATKTVSGKADGVYGYKVEACNARVCGNWSNITNVQVALELAPPEGINTTSAGPSYRTIVSASWSAVSGASGYTLEMTRNGIVSTPYFGAATSTAVVISASDTVKFRLNACVATTCSAWSAYFYPPGQVGL